MKYVLLFLISLNLFAAENAEDMATLNKVDPKLKVEERYKFLNAELAQVDFYCSNLFQVGEARDACKDGQKKSLLGEIENMGAFVSANAIQASKDKLVGEQKAKEKLEAAKERYKELGGVYANETIDELKAKIKALEDAIPAPTPAPEVEDDKEPKP